MPAPNNIENISTTPVVLIPIKPVIKGSGILAVPTTMTTIYSYTAPYDFYLDILQVETNNPIAYYGFIGNHPIGGTPDKPATIFEAIDIAFESPFLPKIKTGDNIRIVAQALTTSVTETTVNFNGFAFE